MSIVDGNPVNAAYTNSKLASKEDDNILEGKQTLVHENIESGADIADTQKTINDHTDAISDLEKNNTALYVGSYPDDPTYEIDQGNPPYIDRVGFYFNTTIEKLRIHDGTNWRTNERALDQAAAVDPSVTDDADSGFEVLSLWLNTVSAALFRATDVTVGAAVWQEIAKDSVLDAHINDLPIHVDWSLPNQGTVHETNYVDNDSVYTHPDHTGEVTSTGDGVQVIDSTAISNKPLSPLLLLAGSEEILINDAGTLKKTTIQDIADSVDTGGVDAVDTLANLTALPREEGKIYYATDTDLVYQDNGSVLISIAESVGVRYWQKKLSANLNSNGAVADLNVSGLTIGEKYQVKLIVQAARIATSSNEIQEINFSATPTYGTFRLNYDGQNTALMQYNTNASGVQSALLALSNLNGGDVTVSGSFGSGYTISFAGSKSGQNVPQITVSANTLVSGESGGANEVQDVTFSATPTQGDFTITFNGQTTSAIPYNATAGAVQSAVVALSNVNGASVSAIANGFRITFTGSFVGRMNINQITTSSNLDEEIIVAGNPGTWPPSFDQTTGDSLLGLSAYNPPAGYYVAREAYRITVVSQNGPPQGPGSLRLNYSNVGTSGGVYDKAIFFSPSGAGLLNWSFQTLPFTGFNFQVWKYSNTGRVRDSNKTLLYNQNNNTGAPQSGSGSVNLGTNDFLAIEFGVSGSPGQLRIDSVIMGTTQFVPVDATPSTFTQGAAPSGGSSTIATPSTISEGVTGVNGPSKLFGANVIHNGNIITTAKTLPSAESAEDYQDTVSTDEFITAQSTTMTVEAEGLGGAETLLSGETKLIVIEQKNSTEI